MPRVRLTDCFKALSSASDSVSQSGVKVHLGPHVGFGGLMTDIVGHELPRRDLSRPLSDPLDLQLKHITDDLRVFVTLGDLFP
jgi:hypothetical protein